MITLSLLTLTALWFVVLHRYPAYFVPKKSLRFDRSQLQLGENWIEVMPSHRHHESPSMQEVG
jgi:hypothetical protein